MTYLADIKSRFETMFTESVTDFIVIQAYNDFASMVERAESKRFGHRHRKEVTVSLPDTGYLLSAITDLQSSDSGFEVFLLDENSTVVKSQNKLERIPHGIQSRKGFYIKEGRLFSNIYDFFGFTSPRNVVIKYLVKTSRVAFTADLTTESFSFDQDLETAFMYYLSMLFYQGQFEPQKIGEAQAWAMGWLNDYFSNAATS